MQSPPDTRLPAHLCPDSQHTLMLIPATEHLGKHRSAVPNCTSCLKCIPERCSHSKPPTGVEGRRHSQDRFDILGTGACLNTAVKCSQCGDGRASTLSYTPHTHTRSLAKARMFSHPRMSSASQRDTVLLGQARSSCSHMPQLALFSHPSFLQLIRRQEGSPPVS